MTPRRGVLDANVVIGLVHGGVFERLQLLYAPLYIPSAVVAEVMGYPTRPGASELQQALGDWLIEVTPQPQTIQHFPPNLPLADRQVLAAAVEHAADHILSSDEEVRRAAIHEGLPCLRVTEVVLALRFAGLLPAVRPVLDQMRSRGFGIDDTLYSQALQAAGE